MFDWNFEIEEYVTAIVHAEPDELPPVEAYEDVIRQMENQYGEDSVSPTARS